MLRFIAANFAALFLCSFILFGAVVRLQPTSPSFRHQSLSVRPSDRSFNILIFSDLHFGEEEHGWGIEQDRKTLRTMDNLLDIEKPDLVVLNGDLITGENTFRENSSAYVDQIVAPMVARDVPWASTYGNHDSSYNLSRAALVEAESKYTLSHTKKGWPQLQGVTNYHVEVVDETGRAVLVLWFLDSQGGSLFHDDISTHTTNSSTNSTHITNSTHTTNSTATNSTNSTDTTNSTATTTTTTLPTEIPGVVGNRTVSWLTHTHEQLVSRHGRVLPSILFVHIPPHIFADAQTNAAFGPQRFPGLNKDAPLSVQHGLGLTDSKLVDALLGLEGLHSIHSGHDHGASWCATAGERTQKGAKNPDDKGGKDGIEKNGKKFLCFARHTGQGGYGPWTRGARVLRITLPETETDDGEMEVDSWVRLANQRRISRVSLNATYGEDKYVVEDAE